ncbi:MAG: hypothetical protein WDN44_14395 [Sphingomonas sp.]
MDWKPLPLLFVAALPGCSVYREATGAGVPRAVDWRGVATPGRSRADARLARGVG